MDRILHLVVSMVLTVCQVCNRCHYIPINPNNGRFFREIVGIYHEFTSSLISSKYVPFNDPCISTIHYLEISADAGSMSQQSQKSWGHQLFCETSLPETTHHFGNSKRWQKHHLLILGNTQEHGHEKCNT